MRLVKKLEEIKKQGKEVIVDEGIRKKIRESGMRFNMVIKEKKVGISEELIRWIGRGINIIKRVWV